MNRKISQWIAAGLVFAALWFVFYETVIVSATGEGEAFEGYFEIAPSRIPYLPVWKIAVPLIIFLGFLFVHYVIGVLSYALSPVVSILAGAVVLFFGTYIPVLSGVPPVVEMMREWELQDLLLPTMAAHMNGVPGLMTVLGVGLVVAGMPRRAAGWLWAFGAFLASTLLLIPVGRICCPDYYFETSVMKVYAVFAFVYLLTIAFLTTVVPYLWPKVLNVRKAGPTLYDVAPYRGKTVREISQNGVEDKRRKLLFGVVDEERVRQWGALGEAIIALHKTWVKRIALAAALLLIWPCALYYLSGGAAGAFNRDVVAMWEVRPSLFKDDEVVGTKKAMIAARRVFRNEGQFLGLTRFEAEEKVRLDLMDPRYKLNKPMGRWEAEQFIARVGDGEDSYALLLGYDYLGKAIFVWCRSEVYPPKVPRIKLDKATNSIER